MNIFEVFPKSRDKLIESLEFSYFLYGVHIHLKLKYQRSQNL
jgi:hypothetical protein